MIILPFLIVVFFTIVFFKKLLFWIWLWQIKQYYFKRVLDHFRTHKGKRLIFNVFDIAKIFALIGLLLLSEPFTVIIFLIYLSEVAAFSLHILKKNFRYPIFTKKAKIILGLGFIFELFILSLVFSSLPAFYIILFDVLAPILIALLVVLFKPLTYFLQKRIIKKAKFKRESLRGLLTIGITGSYGKTSTKEILAEILSQKFKTFKTLKHQNTDPVVAQYILDKLDGSYQVFVAEMGAYFRGGIKSACDFVQPKIGILTGINEQHLALFGSQENIIKTKYELIECLPKDGLAIFNGHSNYCLELYKKTEKPKKIYSLRNNINGIIPDVWTENINLQKELSSFKVVCRDGDTCDFKIKLLGKHSILNILAAVCAAKHLGLSLQEIADTCAGLSQELGGMVLRQGIDELDIIDSSYSSNPDGVISALEYLSLLEGKKAIVLPGLIELGKASKEVHKTIEEKILEVCDVAITTTKGVFEKIEFVPSPGKIVERLKGVDVILLEGRVSKGLIQQLRINN